MEIVAGAIWLLTIGIAYNIGQIVAYRKSERMLDKAVRDKWETLKAENNQ